MPSYPLDGSALAAGSEVWADTIPVIDQSALDAQNSLTCQKEITLKEVMIGAYAGTYDAAGSQALSTTLADLVGGANWDGSFGPTAYNATITATTQDGLTPTIGGIYEVYFSCNWITAAAHTVTFAIAKAGTAVTGAQARSMSVTETASQYQQVTLRCILALTAAQETTIQVACATGTPTLTYRDAIFYIKRIGPSA